MDQLTPEQKAYLETWAGKRDLILSEVSGLQAQKEKLEEAIRQGSDSYTDIQAMFSQTVGRIAELKKQEEESALSVSKELAGLQSQKSVLESEITNLTKLVGVLTEQKTSLEKDVSSAISNFNILKEGALVLDKVVDHVTVVSSANAKMIEDLVSKLAVSLEEIIEVNKKNVRETNIVIDKVPRMIMEAQKKGLIKNKI